MTLRFSIPVFVDHHRDEEGRTYFRARVLFGDDVFDHEERDLREDRALSQLTKVLRMHLSDLTAGMDHRALLPWTFAPALSGHALRLRVELRKQTLQGAFYAVVFTGAGRRLALLPRGRLCFDWPSGTRLEDTAQQVLTEHLRKLEKLHGEDFSPNDWLCGAQPHWTQVSLTIPLRQQLPKVESRWMSLAPEGSMDGAQELRKVGRCLDELDSRELSRAILREEETRELLSWFDRRRTPPPMVLLVGRPKCGKTTLIQECVRRRAEQGARAGTGQFWLVSPQRVISGMSFLGQWEERWTVMLDELRRRRHVLVLDDLPGLFEAGRSSGSDLTLGHVLKARQEHEPVAVLAEATPEQWARLRETDRAFASLFHVIHLRETGDDATLRILVRAMQEIETRGGARFAPEVLPLVMRLQQRFGRARAFPGKAVDMLRALAAAHDGLIDPARVMEWFVERHGIRLAMIDNGQSLTRARLEAFFAERIMGQREAVRAMIDTVLTARAEIQDPRRPLGTLLFLGPTGVGKTECARALAEFVFGGEDRLLRFELNEFTGADAAVRLIGGPGRSGLLTSRVRRQPFSLLLFDEVEKAHPDVFDLLLQVLGEGRLTDAQGRTADFCNCLIILTSNLGAQTARRRLGFERAEAADGARYQEAAEAFFRPEFFNRLDRVVPFHELRREDIERLCGLLAGRALRRQGLRDRRVEVALEGACLRLLAAPGLDPRFGARALRRAVEAHLVEPLAAALLAGPNARAQRVRVSVTGDETLRFDTETFRQAALRARVHAKLSAAELLERLDEGHSCLDDAGEALAGWEIAEDAPDLRAWYYQLRDEATELRRQLDLAGAAVEAVAKARKRAASSRGAKPFLEAPDAMLRLLPDSLLDGLLERALASDGGAAALTGLLDQAQPVTQSSARVQRLLWRSRRLKAACQASAGSPVERAIIEELNGVPLWPKASLCVVERGSGMSDGATVEGRALSPLLEALIGRRLRVDGAAVTWSAVTVDSHPDSGEVCRVLLPAAKCQIDLRTGLCLPVAEEPFDAALAAAFGDALTAEPLNPNEMNT